MTETASIYDEFYELGSSHQKTASDRRKECLLGDLPEDFLRICLPNQHHHHHHHHAYPVAGGGGVGGPAYVYPPGAVAYSTRNVNFLDVTVTEAKLNKNYGLTKMNCYCSIRVGHNFYETPTHHSAGKNPRWNKTFSCPLSKGIDCFYIQIFEEQLFNNSCIAWTLVKIPEIVFHGTSATEQYSLSGKLGENMEGFVSVIMSITQRPAHHYPPWPPAGIPPTVYPQGGPIVIPSYNPAYATLPPPSAGPVVYPQHSTSITATTSTAGANGGASTSTTNYPPPPHQQQQPPPPPQSQMKPRDEDIAALQEMFPDKSCDEIINALKHCHGNKEQAINALLQ